MKHEFKFLNGLNNIRSKGWLLSMLLWLAANIRLLHAQNVPSFSAHSINKLVTIDGKLNEAMWQEAQSVFDFRQFEPREGAPASQKTKVRVLYGDNNIYVGAILYDENPSAIEQKLGPRDDYIQADWFRVSIDSYFSRKTAYTFGVSAGGVQFDAISSNNNVDNSWDAVWVSAIQLTSVGWTAEMKIPYSMLRFSQAKNQIWGIHFTRKIPRLGEQSEWPLIPHTQRSNLVAEYGYMTNIVGIEPKLNLQISPYTNVRLKTSESSNKTEKSVANSNVDIGGNIKYGFGSNITLDATINPDFGQVESDPAVLNLSAFETTFQEKRPFFLEGAQDYQFNITVGEMFYSRRIGARRPIIGAAKLTGRTDGDLSFGILGATTGNGLSPSNNYGVARLNQQIGNYSSIGSILAAFDGASTGNSGHQSSLSGGTDWDIRFSNNQFGVEGFATFARRNWSNSQLNSKTGFASKIQFIKREGIWNGYGNIKVLSDKFDPNALGQLDRNNFIETYARINHEINKGNPFAPFQRANASIAWGKRISYENRLNLIHHVDISSNWMLKTFQQFQLGADFQLSGGYDLYETRGLGPWAHPSTIELNGEFNTDKRRQWMLSPEANYTFFKDGAKQYNLTFGGSWDIGDHFSLSGSVNGDWERNVTAWISNETFKHTNNGWTIGRKALPPDELTSNDFAPFDDMGLLNSILSNVTPYIDTQNQYFVPVFGRRDTRSLGFTLRTKTSFTSKLSLQTYNQLFLAQGRYNNFGILQNPKEVRPFSAYPKRSRFDLNSFQSNIVLRWQYRPGSTIYLVWTHNRRERNSLNPLASPTEHSLYDRSLGKRIVDTFHIFPQNVFMVKVDYTFLY